MAVRARRETLGLRQKDIAPRRGPSYETVRLIEGGEPGSYQPRTLAGLDRSLEWKIGTSQGILDGTAGDDPNAWVDPAVMLVHEGYTLRSYPAGTTMDTVLAAPRNPHQIDPVAFLARDGAIRGLLDYAGVLDERHSTDQAAASTKADILAMVRRLMELPPHELRPGSPSGFVSQAFGGQMEGAPAQRDVI
jgi:hypothetical protein